MKNKRENGTCSKILILAACVVASPVFSIIAQAKPIITVKAKSNSPRVFINGIPFTLQAPVKVKNGVHVIRLKKELFTAHGVKYLEWGGGSKIFVQLSHAKNYLILEILKGRKEIKVKRGGSYVKITPMPELQYPHVFVPLEPLFELLGFSVSVAPQETAHETKPENKNTVKKKIAPVKEKENETGTAKTTEMPQMPVTQTETKTQPEAALEPVTPEKEAETAPAEKAVEPEPQAPQETKTEEIETAQTKGMKEEEALEEVKKEEATGEKKEEAVPEDDKKIKKVDVKWEPAPPKKTEAQSSPTAVSQSPAWQNTQKTPIPTQPGGAMPGALTGALGFSYQTMKTAQGQQFATLKQLSLAWQKPLGSSQALALTTNFNQQNATNAKQQALGGAMVYSNPGFIFSMGVNRNENSTMGTAQTPSSNSKSNDLSLGLNVTSMKSLPLNLTFKRTTAESESGGKVTALNVTTAWSAATTLKLFNRLTTGLNYTSSNAQNRTGNAETKTDSFTLNLSYPISKIFTLNGGLQQTSTESLPQNPDAKSTSDSFSTSVGISANLLSNLSLGLNFVNTSIKNATVQKTQKTSSSAFVATLGYQPSRTMNVTAAFNLSGVKGANETTTTMLTTGYTPQGQHVVVKGVSLSFQETQVENKDGQTQNKTTDVGISQNISPIPELPFNIALKRSTAQAFPVTQGASYSETKSQSVNVTLPNKIGRKFTQSFGFSRTDAESQTGAAPSVQAVTKSFIYNASRQEVFSLGAKQLPATLAYAATFTNASASDSTTHAITASLQYVISPSLSAVYSLSRSMNQTNNAQTSASAASTANNLGLAIKAGKLSGNSVLNLINATGTNSHTLSFTLGYALFPKVTWNNSYNYTGTKASGKSTNTFNLVSGLSYQF